MSGMRAFDIDAVTCELPGCDCVDAPTVERTGYCRVHAPFTCPRCAAPDVNDEKELCAVCAAELAEYRKETNR